MMPLQVTPPANPCHYAANSLSFLDIAGAGGLHDIL